MENGLTIPKGTGIDYTFQVTIYEEDSFTEQDLVNMESAVFYVIDYVNGSKPGGELNYSTIVNSGNGILEFTLTESYINNLDVSEKGDPVDGYYYKPSKYKGYILVKFLAASGIPDKLAIVDTIYVIEA